MALRALEVLAEAAQPLLEPPLDGGERLGEPLAGLPLALGEGGALLFGQAAFLRRERESRVRALAGERAPDLLACARPSPPRRPSRIRACRVSDEIVDGRCARLGARRSPSASAAASRTAAARQAARIQMATMRKI